MMVNQDVDGYGKYSEKCKKLQLTENKKWEPGFYI